MITWEGRVRLSFGNRDQIYTLDPFVRENYWLPGAQVEVVKEIFPLWYCSLIIIHFFGLKAMKLQQEIWGQSEVTSEPQNDWLRDQKQGVYLLSLHVQGLIREESETQQINTRVQAWCNQWNFGGSAPGQFTWHQAWSQQEGHVCLKEEKDRCAGVSRAHWKSFKVYLNSKRDKIRLPKLGLRVACQYQSSVVVKTCILAVSVEREGDGDPCNSKDARWFIC